MVLLTVLGGVGVEVANDDVQLAHDSLTVVLQWCYNVVTVVLQCCYSGVPVVLQWRYSGVTVVLQWCYSGVTAMSQMVTLTVSGLPHVREKVPIRSPYRPKFLAKDWDTKSGRPSAAKALAVLRSVMQKWRVMQCYAV